MVIRLEESQRELIKELAEQDKKSMNQYALDKILAENDSTDSGNDITIKVLSEQIAVKDEQISNMQKLLDQQQRITLAEVGERERKNLEYKDSRSFFKRLFNL